MYFDRVLSQEEELYVNRAEQKIAELTAALAEEYSRNDVDDFKVQLAIELQHSKKVLQSSLLDWTEDDIQMMMDYYTVVANLTSFGYVDIEYTPIGGGAVGGPVGVTQGELSQVEQESIQRDDDLLASIQQEISDRTAADASLQSQIDALSSDGAVLTTAITSEIELGAITIGQVFPIGTPLQDIWIQALSAPAGIENLAIDTYSEILETDVDTLTVSQFTWDQTGTPINLILTDSEGLSVPVAGGSYVPPSPIVYDLSTSKNITWTLTADNGLEAELETKIRRAVVFGKEATTSDNLIPPTLTIFNNGDKSLQDYGQSITIGATTQNNEQGFIFIPDEVDYQGFGKWEVDFINSGDIAIGGFISSPIDFNVGGVIYKTYRWSYRSPLTKDIKLYNE